MRLVGFPTLTTGLLPLEEGGRMPSGATRRQIVLDAQHLAQCRHRVGTLALAVGTTQEIPRHDEVSVPRTFAGAVAALSLEGIDWVIGGGESRPRARPMAAE